MRNFVFLWAIFYLSRPLKPLRFGHLISWKNIHLCSVPKTQTDNILGNTGLDGYRPPLCQRQPAASRHGAVRSLQDSPDRPLQPLYYTAGGGLLSPPGREGHHQEERLYQG